MKILARGILAVSVLFFVGCGDLEQPANEQVIGGEVIVDLDGNSIKKSLIKEGVPGVTPDTTVYGYKAYKIPYTTINEEGDSVDVSGLMVVPTELPAALNQLGLSMVSDSHGTIFANAEAPTVIADATSAPAGSSVILTSLFAFVTLQADYIGFGNSSDHYHPFILKKSLARTTVDFIKAAKKFAADNNIHLNEQLFLTGYSEGGYAAMAALEQLEQSGELQVTMAAPMAGPYIMDGMASDILKSDTLSVPSFVANIGYAYAKAYDEDIASVINEPYASKLDDLFDGTKTRTEIDPELTTVTKGPNGLFKDLFVNDFFSGNWFTQAVVENSVYKWAPQTAVKLVHCLGDDVIPYEISFGTKQTMDGYGASAVSLVPVEIAVTQDPATPLRYGHAECGPVAYGVTAHIFAEVRKATIGY
jgi:hypothetical protein